MPIHPKPSHIPWKDYDKKKLVYSTLKEGQLVTFNHKTFQANDKNPLIYVLEVRSNRVYGLNLRYESKLFYSIMKKKDEEIKKMINKKIQEMSHKKDFLGLSEYQLDSADTRKLIFSEIPEIYKNNFDYPGINSSYSGILRNYLKENIINIFQILYTLPK